MKGVRLTAEAAKRVADSTRLSESQLIATEPLPLPDRPQIYFFRTFILTTDLALGGIAEVIWLRWNAFTAGYEYELDDDEEVVVGEVRDTMGMFSAPKGSVGRAGYVGTESYNTEVPDGYVWEVLYLARLPVAFELAEALTALATVPVNAYRRVWDPSLNYGWGGFEVDCDDLIKVIDWRRVGYYGAIGAHGAGIPRMSDNGVIHVICDLVCTGDEDPNCPEEE